MPLASSILGDWVRKPRSWKALDRCRQRCSEYNRLWQGLSQNHRPWGEPWGQRSPWSRRVLSPWPPVRPQSPGCMGSPVLSVCSGHGSGGNKPGGRGKRASEQKPRLAEIKIHKGDLAFHPHLFFPLPIQTGILFLMLISFFLAGIVLRNFSWWSS